MNESELTPVGNYPNPILAEVAKSALAAQGIQADIFNGKIDGYYTAAVGGIQLMVASGDLEAAQAILAAEVPMDENVVSFEDEISDDMVNCSVCHSKKIAGSPVQEVESDIAAVKALKRIFARKTAYRCLDCGSAWKA